MTGVNYSDTMSELVRKTIIRAQNYKGEKSLARKNTT